ncbi:N-acetylglucosamine-6-phosphate deacetylase [Alkalihalobacterium alkalinitrilicum]|uniref:N-acetylglucosamine-6-phosphate deacetylase n=1 Tax=Alkalihalobacterium alkalinitrilicum TaxID=427920 RepID=UPI00099537DC|nr:N-acetylglucosamine-6-phosphate deacetylase [Alkalihalobacterium alkalinitrilicum]
MLATGKSLLIKGGQVYTEDSIIENGYIKVKGGKIVEIGEWKHQKIDAEYDVVEVAPDDKIIPGFIDIHIHGVNGADTMDATKDALETMVSSLPREGTTSFLATTMTQKVEAIDQAVTNVGELITAGQASGKAEILGIHLEGPFINAKRAGAQPLEHIIEPDLETFKKWQQLSKGNIKLVTLAPEQPGGFEMIRYLVENGIVASIGHTDATYEEVNCAIQAGARGVTHLYNQMRGLHHREPGVVGAALLHVELMAEIIADGIHVRPEMVKLAYKHKGNTGMILISDAMRAKCLKSGIYDLGGQKVTVKNGEAVLHDGTLAGSILKLGDALKNIVAYTGCTLKDAIEMASGNPARLLKIDDKKGSLAEGKDADIVIVNKDLEVTMTFCRGKHAFERGGLTE